MCAAGSHQPSLPLPISPNAARAWLDSQERQDRAETGFQSDFNGLRCSYVQRAFGTVQSPFGDGAELGVSWPEELQFEALVRRIWEPLRDGIVTEADDATV